MLRLLHVRRHVGQRSEALAAPHALQDLTRLLGALAQPHVLAAHQFARQRHRLLDEQVEIGFVLGCRSGGCSGLLRLLLVVLVLLLRMVVLLLLLLVVEIRGCRHARCGR